jgi:hypothetical protein
MEASFMIKQVDTTLSNYTNQYRRLGMQDLAIWQALCQYFAQPHSFEIQLTTVLSKEEVFDQMVRDNWFVDMGQHFYGLDYETTDELVLEYLKDNQLVEELVND